MKRVLSVWLPRWPLQRLCLVRPEVKNRPVLLYGDVRGRPLVRHCSRAALAGGVRPGMPLVEARTLLERGPVASGSRSPPHCEPHDPEGDVELLRSLAEWCGRYAPLVGIEEGEEPQTLLMDITGCPPLFGGEEPMAARVANDFHRAGFFPRVAIADTIGAAWALAHFGEKQSATPTSLVLPPGGGRERLAALPVAALRLPVALVQTLHELDLGTVGQLMNLPRSTLPARLGHGIVDRLDQMFGAVSEVLVPVHPLEPVEADWSFETPTADRLALETVLRGLLGQIVEKLTARQQGVLRLECRLFCTRGEPLPLSIGAVRPRALVAELLELIRWPLEKLALPGEVVRVHLSATATGRLEVRSRELFGGSQQDGKRHLATLVDRLSSRLGEEAVLHPVVKADALPECAGGFVPALSAAKAKAAGKKAARRVAVPANEKASVDREQVPPARRPLALHSSPQPIVTVSVVPDGRPIQFEWNREQHMILNVWGPERIETGWWRGPQVRRDYYRVETTTGRRFWLFREAESQRWFLHGIYE